MRFSILLLGVFLILVLFNVGEGVWRYTKTKKWFLFGIIVLDLGLLLIPNIIIGATEINLGGFVLPVIIGLFMIFRIKKLKEWLPIIFSTLLTLALTLVYNVIDFNVYESMLIQPYILYAVILGTALFFICKKPSSVFISSIMGLVFADIIFYKSSQSFGDYNLVLGSEKFITSLLITYTISLIFMYCYMLIVVKKKRKLFKTN